MRHRLLPVLILALVALPALFAQTHRTGTLHTTTGPGNVVTQPVRWTVVSTPAAGTQASAVKASGGGTVRHVADCVAFSAGSTTLPPALTKFNVDLRDGASGAGTIKKSWTIVVPAETGQNVAPFGLCDLGIVGSQNTAMTLEFSAGLANLFQDVTITGHSLAE